MTSPGDDRERILWACPGAETFIWEQLGTDWALFQPQSGKTHFLTGIAGFVLRELEQGPRTLAQLGEAAETHSQDESPDALRESIAALVVNLEHLGLITTLKP